MWWMILKIGVQPLWICDFVCLLWNWCPYLMSNIDPILVWYSHIIVYLPNMILQMRRFAAPDWPASPKYGKHLFQLIQRSRFWIIKTDEISKSNAIYRYFCFSFDQIGQFRSRIEICWSLGGICWLCFALFHCHIIVGVLVQWRTHFWLNLYYLWNNLSIII